MDTALRLSRQQGQGLCPPAGRARLEARLYNLSSGGAPGLLPQISLGRTDRDLRLIVPAELKRALGDVTARRLQTAAEARSISSRRSSRRGRWPSPRASRDQLRLVARECQRHATFNQIDGIGAEYLAPPALEHRQIASFGRQAIELVGAGHSDDRRRRPAQP